jgi:hypothetical protein
VPVVYYREAYASRSPAYATRNFRNSLLYTSVSVGNALGGVPRTWCRRSIAIHGTPQRALPTAERFVLSDAYFLAGAEGRGAAGGGAGFVAGGGKFSSTSSLKAPRS